MSYPEIGTKGSFAVATPYALRVDTEYSVTAVDSFQALKMAGVDVKKLYYIDKGLTTAKYEQDTEAGTVIVTLFADGIEGTDIVKVPDSFITSSPGNPGVPYSHLVLGVSLGSLPDDFDTSELTDVVGQTVAAYIGVVPTLRVARAPSSGMVTAEEHIALTDARLARVTINDTPAAQVIALQQQIAEMRQRMQLMEEWIVNHPDAP